MYVVSPPPIRRTVHKPMIAHWTPLVIVKGQVSPHLVYPNIMHNVTNLCILGLNWSSKLQKNTERKTPLLCTNLCRCIITCFRPEVGLCYYLSEKLPLSQKLRAIRESRFSQCSYYQQFSIAHYQLSFYATLTIILSNYQ